MIEPWEDLARQLRSSLNDVPSSGAVLEAEEHTDIGATSLDIVVESSGGSTNEQAAAYAALCDLLTTRLEQGSDQVMGCLLIDGDPTADAFATGLDGMQRAGGQFTPVIPLARDRAKQLVTANASLFDLVDKATALIQVAADHDPVTTEVAATALFEVEELVERALAESP